MFTIDLRKGAGLPPKSRPILVGLAVVPFLIPLLGILVTAICWQENRTLIRTQQSVIHENQQKLSGLQDDLGQFRKTAEQTRLCFQKLNEVDKALELRIQTTPLFVELVGNLPEFLTLTKLNLERTERQKQVTAEKTDLVVQRKLKMTISGPATDTTDMAVRQYVQNLSLSPKLSGWVNTIQIISRNNESVNDQQFSLYEIECAMKDQT
jgi:Tfp pilus assembly protein PilN